MSHEQRVLRGRIENYSVRRTTEEFFLTDADRRGMGATALGASALGLVGMGAGVMGNAMSTSEEADLVEFEVAGEKVQGFMWKSPFKEGDEVEVVAEKVGDVWKAFGIARPADRIIAMHPHCSRGSKAHWRVVRYWWIRLIFLASSFGSIVVLISGYFFYADTLRDALSTAIIALLIGCGGTLLITAPIAWSVGRHYRGFVQISETVFRRLGWKDVEHVDLPMRSMEQFKPGDSADLGVLYYRY